MKKSFLMRFFFRLLLVLTFLLALIFLFTYQSFERAIIDRYSQDLQRTNNALVLSLKPLWLSQDIEALRKLVTSSSAELGLRITFIDTTGKVLADSEADPQTMNLHRYRQEVSQALAGRTGHAVRFSTTLERDLLYVATPIWHAGQVVGVLRTSLGLQSIKYHLRTLFWRIGGLVCVALLLMMAVLYFFTRQLRNRIGMLTEAAQRVADGDFNTRIYLHESDEFGRLARHFNAMTTELQQLFQNVQIDDRRLNTIIGAMPSGLAVIASNGRLLFYNAAFERMLGGPVSTERYYWEVLHQPQLIEIIKETQTTRQEKSGECELNQKSYLVTCVNLPEIEETLLLLSDISAAKEIQRLKKEFVVNVSHELRTPLTAIKGFVETLLDEFPRSDRRYLEIIARHTERLINIVKDLLILAQIEETQQLVVEEIHFPSLLEDTLKIFETSLKTKQLYVRTELDPNAAYLKLDAFKMQQVLINLIDNAIKYTDRGGITVKTLRQNDKAEIHIADTGIGIPPEHLPRIFERFYVVDKSRSRRLGGTGLGLAIAKHIVLLHGGTLQVTSQPGQGTCFTITLPQGR